MTDPAPSIYIVSNRPSRRGTRFHIARYAPKGYGVAALCGKSWREGDFRVESVAPPAFLCCATCERMDRVA